jgi:hypothetical protein
VICEFRLSYPALNRHTSTHLLSFVYFRQFSYVVCFREKINHVFSDCCRGLLFTANDAARAVRLHHKTARGGPSRRVTEVCQSNFYKCSSSSHAICFLVSTWHRRGCDQQQCLDDAGLRQSVSERMKLSVVVGMPSML